MKNIKLGNLGFLPVLLILAVIAIVSSVYTIETGTVGIISTFGKYDVEEKQPGIHLKVPFVQKVRVFDVKLQTVNYHQNQDLPDQHGVVNKAYIQVLDRKNLPIGIELTVQYTPKKTEASEILAAYGFNYFEKLINPMIRDVVRDVIGSYQAEKIAADRTAIAKEIRSLLSDKFQLLPFKLTDVALRDIKLPQIVLKKIEEVQLATQEEQRLVMIERQAKKNQEIKTIEANTKLIEVTTQAKADAQKKRIEADAKAYQISKEAQAIAAANDQIAASVTDKLIRYKAVEIWNGQYPTTLMANGKDMMVQLPRLK